MRFKLVLDNLLIFADIHRPSTDLRFFKSIFAKETLYVGCIELYFKVCRYSDSIKPSVVPGTNSVLVSGSAYINLKK